MYRLSKDLSGISEIYVKNVVMVVVIFFKENIALGLFYGRKVLVDELS